MFQTRIDLFLSKKPIDYKNSFIDPWIRIYAEKNLFELNKELLSIERKFKKIDFGSLTIKDNEYLRNLIITLSILNEILITTLKTKEFKPPWHEILQYIPSESKNPSFMFSSMIREIKRKLSFKLTLNIKKKYPIIKNEIFRQYHIESFLNQR